MKYLSTRGGVSGLEFMDTVLMGLADDGGLIVPESFPNLSQRLDELLSLSYPELAFEVMRPFVSDIPADDLKELITRSYSNFPEIVAPVVPVDDLYILELFHGPTLAFKDVALQFLGNLFEYILKERDTHLNILGATSGDTGSAAIYGVRGKDRIHIFIMHPHNRVSPVQELQMTTVLDENVHNIAVDGSFDDCQNIMKELAGDLDFKRAYKLGAVNSVNWARVLAQVVYYFHAAFQVQQLTGEREIQFSVPTGNFGDILAGYYAMRMGLPIRRLILATNENDILSRFFNTGIYGKGEVHQTLSPSMDIQVASNFERYLFEHLGRNASDLNERLSAFQSSGELSVELADSDQVDSLIVAGRGVRKTVLDTIRQVQQDHDYLLDPHTAVGVAVAREKRLPNLPCVCLATAHPAKFSAAVQEATGDAGLAHHPSIDKLPGMPTRMTTLPNSAAAIRQHMEATLP